MMQSRKRILTAILTVFFCAFVSVAAFATDCYWNSADGDWSDATNWDPNGIPGSEDYVHVENGGTLHLSDDASTDYQFYLYDGALIQDGGELLIYNPSISGAQLKIGKNRGANIFDGSLVFDATYAEYNLMDGTVGANNGVFLSMTISYGRFNQYGGSIDTVSIYLRSTEDIAEYNLYAGSLTGILRTYSSNAEYQHGGVFNQYGGICEFDYVSMGEKATYNLHGGSLVINRTDDTLGTFNLGSGGFSLELVSGVLDLSDSTIGDVSTASFQGGAKSLLILPSGFDTATFGSFTSQGLVHIAGSTLTISSGYTIETGDVEFDDHVAIEGTLHVAGDVRFNDGVTFSDGGYISHSGGYNYIVGGVSNIEGSTIDKDLYISPTVYVEVNQSGGTVASDVYIGNSSGDVSAISVYNLSGGKIQGSAIYVGAGSFAAFNQTGGQVLCEEVWLGDVGDDGAWRAYLGNADYTMSDGELQTEVIRICSYKSSCFTQTGGTVETTYMAIGSTSSQRTSYVYAGGTLNIAEGFSINRLGTLKIEVDWACTTDNIDMNGGVLETAEGAALILGAQKSLSAYSYSVISGTIDFNGEDGSIDLYQYSTLDLSKANLINASAASLISESNSLIIVPKGYDIYAVFGTVSIGGTVMEMCDKFVVAAGEDVAMNFTLPMSVEVYGTLRGSLGSIAGITIKSGGVVDRELSTMNLGTNNGRDTGSIIIEDGGSLRARTIGMYGEVDRAATIYQYGGSVQITKYIYIDGMEDSVTAYYQYGGAVDVGTHLQFSGRDGSYYMSGGTLTVTDGIYVSTGGGTGTFYLEGGEVYAEFMTLGKGSWVDYMAVMNSCGTFYQTGGTLNLNDSLQIGMRYIYDLITDNNGSYYTGMNNTGEYCLAGGELIIGGALNIAKQYGYANYAPQTSAIFSILGGRMEVYGGITVWQSGIFDDEGSVGAEIECWGDFYNYSMMTEEFDLRHSTVILHGGTGWDDVEEIWNACVLDMNSADFGATVAGLDINFAIGNLVFSGTDTGSVWYQLESDIYCYGLSIEEGASIDLNGYNIYYMPLGTGYQGVAPGTFRLDGEWINGDVIAITDAPAIPEPGTIAMIGAAVVGLAGAIRRRLK